MHVGIEHDKQALITRYDTTLLRYYLDQYDTNLYFVIYESNTMIIDCKDNASVYGIIAPASVFNHCSC